MRGEVHRTRYSYSELLNMPRLALRVSARIVLHVGDSRKGIDLYAQRRRLRKTRALRRRCPFSPAETPLSLRRGILMLVRSSISRTYSIISPHKCQRKKRNVGERGEYFFISAVF